jgi:hypothetical protein
MTRIIEIDKRRWLVGMTWISFEDQPSKANLKEDAQRLHASWVCVRVGESAIQAGFCSPIRQIKRPSKLYSLAAMLADSRRQPWLGIFKLAEGVWWYIAVRDGHAILPEGDVVGGEETIRSVRERHSGYTDWEYIEGDLDLLGDFINEVHIKPPPIKALYETPLPTLPVVSAVVLLSLLGGAGFWWHKRQQETERLMAMEKMREKLTVSVPVAPSPLLTSPAPNNWLAACGSVIVGIPLSTDGWMVDQVSCRASSVSVRWQRAAGASVARRPKGALSPQGDTIDESIPLASLDQNGLDDAVDLPEAKLTLRAWAQALGFGLTMVEPPPPLPGAKPVDKDVAPLPPHADVVLDLSLAPFGADLSGVPGLRLTALMSTANGWRLEGVLYGKR